MRPAPHRPRTPRITRYINTSVCNLLPRHRLGQLVGRFRGVCVSVRRFVPLVRVKVSGYLLSKPIEVI